MDFEKRFEGPAVLAKWMEIRWFSWSPPTPPNQSQNNQPTTSSPPGINHRMPFLRRCLSFVRDAEDGYDSDDTLDHSHHHHTHPSSHAKSSTKWSESGSGSGSGGLSKLPNPKNLDGMIQAAIRSTSMSSNSTHTSSRKRKRRRQELLRRRRTRPGNLPAFLAAQNGKGKPAERGGVGKRVNVLRFVGLGTPATTSSTAAAAEKSREEDGDATGTPSHVVVHVTLDGEDGGMTSDDTSSTLSDAFESGTSKSKRDGSASRKRPRVKQQQPHQHRQSQQKRQKRKKQKRKRPVFFHYVYLDEEMDNQPATQVEMRQDRRCPLCSLNVCTNVGLILHCRATHTGFFFDGVKDEEGNMHVIVRSDHRGLFTTLQSDRWNPFAFIRHSSKPPPPSLSEAKQDNTIDHDKNNKTKKKKEHSTPPKKPTTTPPPTPTKPPPTTIPSHPRFRIPFIQRPPHKAAALSLPARKKKVRLLQLHGSDEHAMSAYIRKEEVPIRSYYHSRTNLPMLGGDWNYDSDEEADEDWLLEMMNELLDEFEDVSDQEKLFMKLWNRFIMSCTTIPDRSIPSRCLCFVKTFRTQLVQWKLRQNLLLHLCNLWDFSLISADHIGVCMEVVDEVVECEGGGGLQALEGGCGVVQETT